MPKISIIVPVYNVEQYLHQCLESILNQSFEDFELICINDGSTDNSLNILKQAALKDKRIKVINQKNKGQGKTRNRGIKESKGDYVYFVDSDDFLDKKALSKLYHNAVNNKSDVVITKIARFEDDGINYNNPGFDLDNIFKDVDFNNFTFDYTQIKYHVMNSSFAPWTKFYSKQFLDSHDELYFDTDKAYEDVLFHIKVLLRAKKISFLPDFVYFYRNTTNSVTSTKSNALAIIDVCDEVENYLKENAFYEFFEGEFVLFKVKQLMNYLTFSGSEKYYKKTRKYFRRVNEKYLTNSFYNKDYIPKYLLDNIELVINSKTLESYKLRIQINELTNQKNNLFNENRDLKRIVEEKNDENNVIIEEKNKLVAENTQLKTQNQKITEDNQKMNAENKEITIENNNIKTENLVLLNKKDKFELEFKNINVKYETLLKEHDTSVLKNKEYQQRLNDLNKKVKDYDVLVERNKEYEKNIQELNLTVKDNEKELANNNSALEKMNLKISNLIKSNKEFQQNNVDLLLKSNKQLKTIDSLEDVIEEKNNDYVFKCLELSNSIEHAEKIALELSNLKSINHSQNKENAYLKNKISTLNRSLTIKNDECHKIQEKSEKIITDLNLENKNLNLEISDLNTKISDLNCEITDLNKEISDSKKEINDLTMFKDDLLNSNSWKLMKPLRSLKNMNKN